MIYLIKEYTNDDGKQVTEKYPTEGEVSADTTLERYGTIYIAHPQAGQIPFQFKFPEDFTLEKCFETFEEEAEKAITVAQKEAQEEMRNQIVTPGGPDVGDGGIITPN